MKSKLGNKQRILHMLEAIAEIEQYTLNASSVDFTANSMMRFASIKQLEIIGEAANMIDRTIRDQYSQVEWRQVIGLRHILVHEYFGVDPEIIWQIISTDVAKLKIDLNAILRELPE